VAQVARPVEHRVEHRLGERAGERVLLARVVRAQQRALRPVADRDLDAVPELGLGSHAELAAHDVVRELAEHNDHAHVAQQCELAPQVGQARLALGDRGLVDRRRAPHGGGDVAVGELQAVVDRHALGLVGVAGAVQRGEEPVARTIAGEHPPGAVPAVGRRRQPDDQQACARVAEARHGTPPVRLVAERRPLLERDLLAPRDESRAQEAVDDVGRDRLQRIHAMKVG
jgi:hypothetical protein